MTPGIKGSLVVRLPGTIPRPELSRLAEHLRSDLPAGLPLVFITYLLPGMEPGAGAWATTHFRPDLAVVILGMDTTTEAELRTRTPDASAGEIVGAWMITSASIPGRIEIYRHDDGFLLRQTLVILGDRADLESPLREIESQSGRRFEPEDAARSGEYFLIRPDGTLEVGNRERVFATGQRVE